MEFLQLKLKHWKICSTSTHAVLPLLQEGSWSKYTFQLWHIIHVWIKLCMQLQLRITENPPSSTLTVQRMTLQHFPSCSKKIGLIVKSDFGHPSNVPHWEAEMSYTWKGVPRTVNSSAYHLQHSHQTLSPFSSQDGSIWNQQLCVWIVLLDCYGEIQRGGLEELQSLTSTSKWNPRTTTLNIQVPYILYIL